MLGSVDVDLVALRNRHQQPSALSTTTHKQCIPTQSPPDVGDDEQALKTRRTNFCGEEVSSSQPESEPVKGTLPSLTSVKCAISDLTKERLTADKKLILLVDLDSTLMQSTRDYAAKVVCGDRVHQISAEAKIICSDSVRQISTKLHVMLRPNAREFLKKCNEMYELIVVTNSSKSYAVEVVKLLDPDATLFKNRIIALEDMKDLKMLPKVKRGVIVALFHENVRDRIAIIDDKASVWRTQPIIQIPAYKPFCSKKLAFDPSLVFGMKFDDPDNELMSAFNQKLLPLHQESYVNGVYVDGVVKDRLQRWWERDASNVDYTDEPDFVTEEDSNNYDDEEYKKSVQTQFDNEPALNGRRTSVCGEEVSFSQPPLFGLSKESINKKLILLVEMDRVVLDFTQDPDGCHIKSSEKRGDYWIKVRPHAHEMFNQLDSHFEFVACIDLSPQVSQSILDFIDPAGKIFKGRIISQCGYGGIPRRKNNIKDLFHEGVRDRIVILDLLGDNPATFPVLPYSLFRNHLDAFPNNCYSFQRLKDVVQVEIDANDKVLLETVKQLKEISHKSFEESQFSPFHFAQALDSQRKYSSDEIQRVKMEQQRESEPVRGTAPSLTSIKCAINDLTKERLTADKKLILLVDLDSTVMQSTRDYAAKVVCGDKVRQISTKQYVMLRPNAREFLKKCSEMYELIVVTNSSKSYAGDVVKLLDPDATLFRNRIIGLEDMEDLNMQPKVKRGIIVALFHENVRDMIAIIDDEASVWRTQPIIQIPAYKPFCGKKLAFDSSLVFGKKFDDPDNELMSEFNQKLLPLHQESYVNGVYVDGVVKDRLQRWWERDASNVDYTDEPDFITEEDSDDYDEEEEDDMSYYDDDEDDDDDIEEGGQGDASCEEEQDVHEEDHVDDDTNDGNDVG